MTAPDRWPRPRPVIGDRSSSSERARDLTGWALPATARASLAEVIGARRDVRRFRPDAVDDALLERVLGAGHAAPSVGHSQPWRFVVVRDAALRGAAAAMADRARLEQARGMTEDDGRHLKSLQLDGLREAPLGVVVCCDRRVSAGGVLGRATFPDADLWSCACAIENMWLTARAEGLGLGWVTLFEPDELAQLLQLPPGVVTLGWLCLGWPDERPPAPGLERQGWSARLALEDVVIYDTWSEPAPGPPRDRAVDAYRQARVATRDREDELLATPGSLGLLSDTLLRVGAVSHAAGAGTLVIAAADHPVAQLGVSAYPATTTRLVAAALSAGEGQGAVAAREAGMAMRLIDCGIDGGPLEGWSDHRPRGPRGNLADADAMSVADAVRLVEGGERLGRQLSASGPVAVGEVGIGNTTVAAALACALLDRPAAAVVGRGAASDTGIVRRKEAVIERAVIRAGWRPAPGPLSRQDLVAVLATLGGPEQALLTGVCLGVADAGGLVVLDGMLTGTAALLATRHRSAVQAHLVAGQLSAEPGHRPVLDALGLEPLLDLRLRAGEGIGAVLATSLLRQCVRIQGRTARTAG